MAANMLARLAPAHSVRLWCASAEFYTNYMPEQRQKQMKTNRIEMKRWMGGRATESFAMQFHLQHEP